MHECNLKENQLREDFNGVMDVDDVFDDEYDSDISDSNLIIVQKNKKKRQVP